MKVDHISLSTTPSNLLKGNDLVSQGTGFYYVRSDGDLRIGDKVDVIGILPEEELRARYSSRFSARTRAWQYRWRN